jgi:anthranilate synthase component 1
VVTFGYAATISKAALKTVRLETRLSPQQLFARIQQNYDYAFLLESAKGPRRLAEFSFIGFDPSKIVTVKDGSLVELDRETGDTTHRRTSDPLEDLRKITGTSTSEEEHLRFVGGAVGYISYDAIRYWEKLPRMATDNLSMPDFEFGIYNDGIVFDHGTGQVSYHTLGEDRLEAIKKDLREDPSEMGALRAGRPVSSTKKERYESMIERAKEYIMAGDIFQVVLSKRLEFDVTGDLGAFYRSLSRINPSPYMYFLKLGGRRIIGSSPEMLVRVENRVVETFPIAGTRPTSPDPKKNSQLTEELLADPKEMAEHVMLVDLARNDVGRVASYGSVRVPELITVQQFSHVQHIVSHVVGDLRPECDSYDALRAIFPAGTVSGAPKPRAMEIIDELEPFRRGAYAGAVGYFSFNGNADFAITIRTLVTNGRRGSIQAGAGIVADSSPETEWFESEAKAAALMRALADATKTTTMTTGEKK